MRKLTHRITSNIILVTLSLSIGISLLLWLDQRKIRGLRLDPAFLYQASYLDANVTEPLRLARAIIKNYDDLGVNTLFVRAYDPRFGAYYRTEYPSTEIEKTLGNADFLPILIQEARRHNIKVVAWLSVNDFKQVWIDHPDWRSKQKDGSDFHPNETQFLLSAGHPAFLEWYRGFLDNLIHQVPGLAGLEAAEGIVDPQWDGSADFNQVMLRTYSKGNLSKDWRIARAAGMTAMHETLAMTAHALGLRAYVVQTWSVNQSCDGSLLSSPELRDATGFDPEGVLTASRHKRVDVMIVELMWQQWRASCASRAGAFTPDWTARARHSVTDIINGRAAIVIHIELTGFSGPSLNREQFAETLEAAQSLSSGLDVYDFHQLHAQGLASTLQEAYQPLAARIAQAWTSQKVPRR